MTDGQPLDVLVVGSLNADVFATVAELPRPGQTVSVLGGADEALGGKGANQAMAAAAAGARTALVGAVGSDERGEHLLRQLSGHLDTDLVVRVAGPTGWAHVLVDAAGENLIVVHPGANAGLDPQHLAPAFERYRPRVVLVQLEIPPATATAALAAGRRVGATTVCNASPVVHEARHIDLTSDVLVVNREESRLLSEQSDVAEAGRFLAARTHGHIVTTLGGEGVLVTAADGTDWRLPARHVDRVVDTTGAGDVFAGFLTASLAAGKPLRTAIELAMLAGAWAVTRPGIACPTMRDITTSGAGEGEQ